MVTSKSTAVSISGMGSICKVCGCHAVTYLNWTPMYVYRCGSKEQLVRDLRLYSAKNAHNGKVAPKYYILEVIFNT